ncbi:hypothetical protein LFL97_09815 [Burkholderia sp. JSH-S8]|uniref:hypothetical protein n=1 Tax=Burkholderia stagnalis TaxID=1503054 RepID=UPI000F80C092|nr:hypothetical protein [Burkholderia stagnalis]WGS43790.1 hypothetical protein LFL97_09815 [Burkholderia sp. JSH-S8]
MLDSLGNGEPIVRVRRISCGKKLLPRMTAVRLPVIPKKTPRRRDLAETGRFVLVQFRRDYCSYKSHQFEGLFTNKIENDSRLR